MSEVKKGIIDGGIHDIAMMRQIYNSFCLTKAVPEASLESLVQAITVIEADVGKGQGWELMASTIASLPAAIEAVVPRCHSSCILLKPVNVAPSCSDLYAPLGWYTR